MAPFWTRGSRCLSSELDLAAEDGLGPPRSHHKKNQVGCFAAHLHSDARAFKSVHCRRTPWPREVSAAPAHHGPTTASLAHSHRHLQHRRKHDHTLSLLQKLMRNVVREAHDLFHDYATALQAFLMLVRMR